MSFPVLNEQIVTALTTVSTDGKVVPWFKFPRAGEIKSVYACAQTGVTGTTNTYAKISVLNGGTAGTSTAVVASVGGASVTWTAATGKKMTISGDGTFSSDQWAMLKYNEAGTVALDEIAVVAHVVLGIAAL